MWDMTISIYFDQRAAKDGQPAPIKFVIRKNGKAAVFCFSFWAKVTIK